ncbi:hypothetical protein M0R72_13440 [Candidatus Pacearchaeota archaeon]|jgi:hypothetical protein|nr:hypothetical protein [Candidatus Pacearchaeota archaeon]
MTITEILPLIGGAAGICSVVIFFSNRRKAAIEIGKQEAKMDELCGSVERAWSKIEVIANGEQERAVQYGKIEVRLDFISKGVDDLGRTMREEIKGLRDAKEGRAS